MKANPLGLILIIELNHLFSVINTICRLIEYDECTYVIFSKWVAVRERISYTSTFNTRDDLRFILCRLNMQSSNKGMKQKSSKVVV